MNKDELKEIIIGELTKHIKDIIFNKVKELPFEHSKRQRIDYLAEKIVRELPDIITEDYIVEVLNRTVATLKYKSLSIEESVRRGAFISARYTNEDIAKEILKGQGWEVVDRIKIYEGNKASIEFDVSKYEKPVNIEIAIRRVK